MICYDGHIKVNLFAQQIRLYAKPTNRARDFGRMSPTAATALSCCLVSFKNKLHSSPL